MNLAFFASYNGSSAHAITDACLEGEIIAAPTLLITNNPEAKALEWAENKGLKTAIINAKTHEDALERDRAIADKLVENKITLVALSGYMKLIGSEIINAVDDKIINIHPALLPKYGGQGMFGSNVHQAVKDNNESETGITIHQVNEQYDEGKILAQKKIPLTPTDTAADIEEKVKAAEPEFYVDTIRKIQKGLITI
ncbi:MAG: phosphoribosylglycinamide formyltransferase [Pseudomonadota bacterium]